MSFANEISNLLWFIPFHCKLVARNYLKLNQIMPYTAFYIKRCMKALGLKSCKWVSLLVFATFNLGKWYSLLKLDFSQCICFADRFIGAIHTFYDKLTCPSKHYVAWFSKPLNSYSWMVYKYVDVNRYYLWLLWFFFTYEIKRFRWRKKSYI